MVEYFEVATCSIVKTIIDTVFLAVVYISMIRRSRAIFLTSCCFDKIFNHKVSFKGQFRGGEIFYKY